MRLDNLPKELLSQRGQIEGNFIMTLYKDISLVDDYKNVLNGEDIITEDGKFYYGLLLGIHKYGYKTADNVSIDTYLEDKPVMKQGYEKRGGYGSIREITDLLSVDNIETYYDNLSKNNLLIRLHNAGFDVVGNLGKFSTMSSDEVYDFYDYQLANIKVDKIEKVKIDDLSSGYDEWIKRANSSENVGYKVGSRLLDYQLAGIHKGCLTLYLGGIGQGKSSSAVSLFILPAIETGNDICILCNEQSADEYRSMIVAAVLFGKIGDVKGMNRMTITRGHFNEYQTEKLKEATAWIEKQPGKIKFVELADYDVVNVKKIVKQQSKIGCGYFFFDVLKNMNDADPQAWAILSDMAKTLSVLAKTENVAIVASAQLAADSMNRKYLDLSAVGKSRAISECATAVIGFRPIMNNEVDKIKPWIWKQGEDGRATKIKQMVELNDVDHYIMVFVMKNRWGNITPQIVMKFNQNFNTIQDVGYFEATYDDFRR